MTRYEQHPLDGLCFEDILEWVPRVPQTTRPTAPVEEPEPSAAALLVRELLHGATARQEPDVVVVAQRRADRRIDRTLELDEGDLELVADRRFEVTEPPVPSRRASSALALVTLLLLLGALIHVTAPGFTL